ncbi:MAG TPA: hypothetical protein PKK10_15150 [Woeseiaceae bacterium]|nr:hypothetical protein [Woeseiaceae bacterium]
MSFGRITVFLALSTAIAFASLEVYFRLPWTPRLVAFDYDPELLYRYSPRQSNVAMFLGNYSIQSPRIRINNRGFRGAEPGSGHPEILVVGSSEVVGPGVREDQTITARLQAQLSKHWAQVRVVNAATGGYGPGHQRIVLQRELELNHYESIIVRVADSDASFVLPAVSELESERAAKARRDRIRHVLRSAPFVANRLRAQLDSIRAQAAALQPAPQPRAEESERRSKVNSSTWPTRDWHAMIEMANAAESDLIFYVPNGENKPENTVLCEVIEALPGKKSVWEYGMSDFRVSSPDEYRARYTLGYDPHGNAERYKTLAQLLVRDIWNQHSSRCG